LPLNIVSFTLFYVVIFVKIKQLYNEKVFYLNFIVIII